MKEISIILKDMKKTNLSILKSTEKIDKMIEKRLRWYRGEYRWYEKLFIIFANIIN